MNAIERRAQRRPRTVLLLADLAARLEAELASAAALANDCQRALGEALTDQSAIDDGLVERLQRLDELAQRLSDMAGVLGRIAMASAHFGAASPDVLGDMRLAGLRARLAGELEPAPDPGEAELW